MWRNKGQIIHEKAENYGVLIGAGNAAEYRSVQSLAGTAGDENELQAEEQYYTDAAQDGQSRY